MSLWLVRAGRHGQHEDQFLEDGRIYMTWGGVDTNLAVVQDREDVRNIPTRTRRRQ